MTNKFGHDTFIYDMKNNSNHSETIINKTDRRLELESFYPEAVFADGFDQAIIGWQASLCVIVYDYFKCMNVLMERDGMTKDEAHEYMEFNVVSAYVGEFSPSFVHIYE